MLHRLENIPWKIYILFILWMSPFGAFASQTNAHPMSDSTSYISLITCSPGDALYARYGHTALRVYAPQGDIDWIFNYGIFDFNTQFFYWKFVRGETWYQLGIDYTHHFLATYAQNGRKVYEQILNLNIEQKQVLYDALVVNYQPQNRSYLYNFVYDNCATRPYSLIKQSLDIKQLSSSYKGWEGKTYRSFIDHYTRPGSYESFGINLIFGSRSQVRMNNEERLFLPEELMFYMQDAQQVDGTPLIIKSHCLTDGTEGIAPFVIKTTPWYATWYVGLIVLALINLTISLLDRKRGKLSTWFDIIMGIIYLVILIIVIFLTCFSIHPLVGFGWRLLIIPIIHLCCRLVYIVR